MDVETKIAKVASIAQEIITEDDLRALFESNEHPIVYDGFEPSGIAPIHFGLLRAKNIKVMMEVGMKPKLYMADYFALINNKMGGDLEKITATGRYFIEVWKACGIEMDKVEVVWASKLMDNIGYWDRFIRVGKGTTIDRAKRAVTIMGRKEGDQLSAAQLFYPAMQVTDIFQMDVDVCQMGMDQRRANILAREVAQKYGWKAPVAVHHPLILGLMGVPELDSAREDMVAEHKMSKSKPESAIFVHDSEREIKDKISKAYCPERIVEGNPIINYLEILIARDKSLPITIERPEKFGGNMEFGNYQELISGYKNGKIHPMDLKNFVAVELEKMISPIRSHFQTNSEARELYETVKGYTITR